MLVFHPRPPTAGRGSVDIPHSFAPRRSSTHLLSAGIGVVMGGVGLRGNTSYRDNHPLTVIVN
eukprot:scaffold24_cov186-Alexandrium_tamarense.AAC.15